MPVHGEEHRELRTVMHIPGKPCVPGASVGPELVWIGTGNVPVQLYAAQ